MEPSDVLLYGLGFFIALFCWVCCGGCYLCSFVFHTCDYGFTTDHCLPKYNQLYGIFIASALELLIVPPVALGVIPLVLPPFFTFIVGCGLVIASLIFHFAVLVYFYRKFANKEDEVYIAPTRYEYYDARTGHRVADPNPVQSALVTATTTGTHNFVYMADMGTVNRHAAQLMLIMNVSMMIITPVLYIILLGVGVALPEDQEI